MYQEQELFERNGAEYVTPVGVYPTRITEGMGMWGPYDFTVKMLQERGYSVTTESYMTSSKTEEYMRVLANPEAGSVLRSLEKPLAILQTAVIKPDIQRDEFDSRFDSLNGHLWTPSERESIKKTYHHNRNFLLELALEQIRNGTIALGNPESIDSITANLQRGIQEEEMRNGFAIVKSDNLRNYVASAFISVTK